jgi:type I restriction enzyme S subunit
MIEMADKKLKVGNVPPLRFPEFEGEWEKKRLGGIGDVKMCRRVFNNETSPTGDIPFFKIGSFGKVADAFISKELYLDYKNRFSFPKQGDILISAAGTIGRTVVYDGEDAYFQDSNIVWIENDNKMITNNFLYYIFQIVKYNTEGGTIQRLYNNILKSTKFNAPSITEQNKIASFLSLIDERISTQNKIIEELTLLKNTISRKILSRHLKFKDESGNEFPMWELKKLREVLLKNSKKNKLLRYSTVQSVSNKFGFINQEDFFEDRRVASIDTSNYYVIKKGTFAYNPSRIDVGSLAYKADDNVSIISPLYISFQANSNYLIDNFLLNWFFGIEFIHQMHNSFEGSVRNTLSYESLEKINISIPSIAEQAKISDYLLSFTNKIEIENTLLRSLQREKKYFLLNLFI